MGLSFAMADIPVRAGQGRVPPGDDPAFSAAVLGRDLCGTGLVPVVPRF
jgi:hypothetical protein